VARVSLQLELVRYLEKSFSSKPSSDAYRSNYDAVFGRKDDETPAPEADKASGQGDEPGAAG